MAIPAAIEKALRSPKPFEELRASAIALLAEGRTEKAVCDLFEAARASLRLESREVEEDIVMDVMDCLAGWCSPHHKLEAPAVCPSVPNSGQSHPAAPISQPPHR